MHFKGRFNLQLSFISDNKDIASELGIKCPLAGFNCKKNHKLNLLILFV